MADEKTVSETALFEVEPGQPLTLVVTIGEAQVGATIVRLNGIVVPFPNQQAPAPIGVTAPPSILDCVTLVEDVNPATNRTTVTYRLETGALAKEFTYTLEASEKGRVRYEVTFILV